MTPSAPPDWRELLMPIDATAIAGRDLRNDSDPQSIYWRTRELRDDARRLERNLLQGHDQHAQLQQLWQYVANNAHEILSTHSKDFDVIAWWIEAHSRLHGVRGLADGLLFFAAFLREYWVHAFPPNAACEQPADRISAFSGLNGGARPGTIIDAIHGMSVTAAEPNTRHSLWQYLTAHAADAISDITARTHRTESLGFSLTDIRCAAAQTPSVFYRDAISALECATLALQEISDLFAPLLNEDAPSTAHIREAMESLGNAFAVLSPTDTTQRLLDGHATMPQQSERHAATDATLMIHSRADAIVQLDGVARYFRQTEPHSPLSDGIFKLIRWAQLPFSDLMRELITDSSTRTQFRLMTGVDLEDAP